MSSKTIKDKNSLIGIPIEVIVSQVQLPFDLYVKIRNTKYILISDANKPIDIDKVKEYQGKGTKILYILKDDMSHFEPRIKANEARAKLIAAILQKADGYVNPREYPGLMLLEEATVLKDQANDLIIDLQDIMTRIPKSIAKDSLQIVKGIIDILGRDEEIVEYLLEINSINKFFWNKSVVSTIFCVAFCKYLGEVDVLTNYGAPEHLITIGIAGLVKDIGLKNIESDVLLKGPRMSLVDRKEMAKHPHYSVELMQHINGFNSKMQHIIMQHHENWNRTGYPNGLFEDKIYVLARITRIADAFAELICDKPYGKQFTAKETLQIMKNDTGSYEPHLLNMFLRMFKEKVPYKKMYRLGMR